MSGRNGPRSKTGCQTCRQRKVKCDEARPICNRCNRLKLGCEWASSGRRGGKNLQFRSLQAKVKSRQWFLASLWQHYGQSPVYMENGTSINSYEDNLTMMRTPQATDLAPWSSNSNSKTNWGSKYGGGAIAMQFQLHSQQQQARSPFSHSFSPQTYHSPQYHDIYNSTLFHNPAVPIPCANALTLTAADRKYFAFFPSCSVVYYYMKPWDWSSFGFLYKAPAASSKLIMRMILAIAASDIHRRKIFADSDPMAHQAAKYHGRHHYGLAVQEFRQLLEQGLTNNRDDRSSEDVEMIFCTMFLMITFEGYFGNSVKHLQMHLQGVKCLVQAHPELFARKEARSMILMTEESSNERPSFLPAQFLLWTLYIEIICHPMGLDESLYDILIGSGNADLHPDSLHRCARIWARCLWGEQYPDSQVMDDMENYRALELLHHSFLMRNKIWQLALGTSSTASSYTPESLFEEIMNIREKYSDLFLTAKFSSIRALSSSLSNSTYSPSHSSICRTLITTYFAVTSFEAQFIAHRRLLQPNTPPSRIHQQAVTNVLELLYKQHSADPRLLSRLPWAIFLVMIESEDPIHQDWARARLEEIKGLHEANNWIYGLGTEMRDIGEKIEMGVSGDMGGLRGREGDQVDLAQVLRRRHLAGNSNSIQDSL